MRVRCNRCDTEWEAVIKEYPRGERFINCPTCHRGYVQETEGDHEGAWYCDRFLTIMEE